MRRAERPAAVEYFRSEDDRGIASFGALGGTVSCTTAPDHDDRFIPFDAIEKDWNTVVHCESDDRAIRRKLRVDDARKGLGEVDAAAFEIQDGLLRSNVADQRRKIHAEVSHRAAKLIDVREPKYPRCQAWLESTPAHPAPNQRSVDDD